MKNEKKATAAAARKAPRPPADKPMPLKMAAPPKPKGARVGYGKSAPPQVVAPAAVVPGKPPTAKQLSKALAVLNDFAPMVQAYENYGAKRTDTLHGRALAKLRACEEARSVVFRAAGFSPAAPVKS